MLVIIFTAEAQKFGRVSPKENKISALLSVILGASAVKSFFVSKTANLY